MGKIEENEALIRRVYDEYNKGNYDVYDECFTDDFVSIRHDGSKMDKTSYKQFLTERILRNNPDIQRTIDDLIVTEDRAALYYTWTGTDNAQIQGRPTPSGKKLSVKELYFIRFKDGKISEYRQYGDVYGMMLQMGGLADRRPLEENKEVVRGCIEELSNIQGDIEKLDTLYKFFSPEFVHHSLHDVNLDQIKLAWQMACTAFPDMKHEIHDIIAEGDKVVVRMTTSATHKGYLGDIPPTNKKISYSVTDTFRVSNSKIQEGWPESDILTLYQEMGVLPPSEEFIQAYIDSLK